MKLPFQPRDVFLFSRVKVDTQGHIMDIEMEFMLFPNILCMDIFCSGIRC